MGIRLTTKADKISMKKYYLNIIKDKDQRIAELEQELAKLKEKYNKANEKLKNITEEVENNFVHGQDYEKLKQELAELKEKYIIPKFQLGQTIFTANKPNECIYELKIVSIHIERSEFYDRKFNSLVYRAERIKDGFIGGYSEAELFATEQEAQEKLKEMQGDGQGKRM